MDALKFSDINQKTVSYHLCGSPRVLFFTQVSGIDCVRSLGSMYIL